VRRVQVALLLLAVLCVPALTRVTQHLTSVATSHESSGFSKSADSAPERVTIAPVLRTVASMIAPTVEAVQPAWAQHRVDVRLPASVPIPTPRPLRAPPSAVRS